ncbi:MAG: hypothetical protein NTX50_12720 [Candidatus Sumerlaeota bacterium]|nr:hypothetical protein [Candidatus Sumerlaeota bacterium]
MKRKIIVALKWTVIVMIALGLIYIVLLVGSVRSLRHAYAELAAQGRPMKASEIIPPEVSPEENAAPLYQAAVQQLKTEPAGTTEALRLLELAAQKPRCRYDLDYAMGPNISTSLPKRFEGLRSLSRMTKERARAQAEEGDVKGAWHTVATGLKLADAVREEPLVMSQMIRMAQFNQCVDAIDTIAWQAPPPPEETKIIRNLLKSFDDPKPFVRALDGERLLYGETFFSAEGRKRMREFSKNGEDAGGEYVTLFGVHMNPIVNAWYAVYLRLLRRLAEIASQPYAPPDQDVARMIQEIPWYGVVARIAGEQHNNSRKFILQSVAMARVTRAGLAALQYRQMKGAYPKSLEDLGDINEYNDPFVNAPLRYRSDGKGFIIYSVGADQQDNNGSSNKGANRLDKDVVWRHEDWLLGPK